MDDVKEIEQELRRSLQHVAAPEGFTERVMLRVVERERARSARGASGSGVFAGLHGRPGWWMAAAAALVLSLGGADALHLKHVRQQREAAVVQAQLDLAMQMTNHALNEVEVGLDRSPMRRFTSLWNGTQK